MKRFYKTVSIEPQASGYHIHLDDRPVRTPAKAVLLLPNRVLAEAVQAEWREVEQEIYPDKMLFYSMAVTVIDRVTPQRNELAAELAGYIHDDVLRYRSEDDPDLAMRQSRLWDPWLDWAKHDCGLHLAKTSGVMPMRVDAVVETRLTNRLAPLSDAQFSCLYRASTLASSVVLGLAFQRGRLDAETLFETAFLDELYQNSLWGIDEEALRRQKAIRSELRDIEKFMNML